MEDLNQRNLNTQNRLRQLFCRLQHQDQEAFDELFEYYYPHLKRQADHLIEKEKQKFTYSGGDLVHELYIKWSGNRVLAVDEKAFKGFAHKAMRQILIDYRTKFTTKQRTKTSIPIDKVLISQKPPKQSELQGAIDQLGRQWPFRGMVAYLKMIEGKTLQEIAEDKGLPFHIIAGHWRFSKQYLIQSLKKNARTSMPGQ